VPAVGGALLRLDKDRPAVGGQGHAGISSVIVSSVR
jgi:hypothetical protein